MFFWNSYFFDDPKDFGNLIFGSSAFSKSSLYIWKFSVMYYRSLAWRILSITLLGCEECNCAAVWTFFGTALCWDWNENWPFPVLSPLLSFPNLLAYWVQHFNSTIWEAMKCVKILPKFVPFWWACFIRLLFIAFTYNKKGSPFCLICLDYKDSVAYQNNFICLCWL